MRRCMGAFASGICVGLLCATAHATTYYVRSSGNDGHTGLSPDQAWHTITYAAAILQAGDRVWIGPGTYSGPIVPPRSGTQEQPICFWGNPSGEETEDERGPVYVEAGGGTEQAVLVILEKDYLQFRGLTIRQATIGGVYVDRSRAIVLRGCRIRNNRQVGVAIRRSGVTLRRCVVAGHRLAGVGIDRGRLNLIGCRVFGNRLGGVVVSRARAKLVNNFIHDNAGGVLAGNGSELTVTNNTFVGNTVAGLVLNVGQAQVRNSIFAHSTGLGILLNEGNIAADYNLYHANQGGTVQGLSLGAHSIAVDPLFVNLDQRELHIVKASGARELGDTSVAPRTDIDGAPRNRRSDAGQHVVDIGADEWGTAWIRVRSWAEVRR